MKSRNFATALWADSWEKATQGSESEQGDVSFDEVKGTELDIPFGEILADPGVLVAGGPQLPCELDWLYGFSQDGYWLAIKDVVSGGTWNSFPGGARQKLRATWLLYSKGKFSPTDMVTSVSLEIRGLAEWLGNSPINEKILIGKERNGFSLKLEPDADCRVPLLEADGLGVSAFHGVGMTGSSDVGFRVDHRCLLEMLFDGSKPLVDAVDSALWAADFFSLCLGFHGEVNEIKLKFEDSSVAYCLIPLVKGNAPKDINASRIVLPYREIREDLGGLLAAWMKAEEGGDLHSPASLLASLMTRNWVLPLDLKFIAAAQMLEALSRVGADLNSMTDEEFHACKKARKKALSRIEDLRIAGLLRDRFQVTNMKGQNRLLTELVERHEKAADLLFGDATAFIRSHRDLRNGITHRNGGLSPVDENLYWHTEGVLLFAYCVVWEILGMEPGRVERLIEEHFYRNGAIRKCRELYPKKEDASETGD